MYIYTYPINSHLQLTTVIHVIPPGKRAHTYGQQQCRQPVDPNPYVLVQVLGARPTHKHQKVDRCHDAERERNDGQGDADSLELLLPAQLQVLSENSNIDNAMLIAQRYVCAHRGNRAKGYAQGPRPCSGIRLAQRSQPAVSGFTVLLNVCATYSQLTANARICKPCLRGEHSRCYGPPKRAISW